MVVTVLPSPKVQTYEVMDPNWLVEEEPSKATYILVTLIVKEETGRTVGTVTVEVLIVLEALSLSTTVRLIV